MKPLVLALLMTMGLPALAQQAAPEANRERAQMRRVQAALLAAQAQVDGLTAEKAALAKEKTVQTEDALRQRSALRSQQQQRDAALSQIVQMRQDIAVASARQQQAEAQAVERETQLQQQLTTQRSELAELRQSNTNLVSLLERKTLALATAETQNRELQSLGLQAVEMWRNKTPFEAGLASGSIFGVARVREEDAAEALRARIDAQRVQ